ncbi:MAG: aldo/keto reductase, partial [Acidobacteriota bacterium]|nr:aldo/keto reductase [Acidobacteriota bacterium]
MKYRIYGGNSGFKVSELTFGTMRFAPNPHHPGAGEATGRIALHQALDQGINLIHSSYEYGTQDFLRSALKERSDRHNVHHIIKGPIKPFEKWEEKQTGFNTFINNQLKALDIDYIDILQLRAPTWEVVDPQIDFALEVKRKGKLRFISIFGYTMDLCRRGIRDERVDSLIAYFWPNNMMVADCFPLLEKAGKQIILIAPLGQGLFSDNRSSWKNLPDGDRFKTDEGKKNFKQREKIAKEIVGIPESWSAFAIGLPLSQPVVSSLVVSMNKPG